MKTTYNCQICGKKLDESETYEYRGFYACENHFEELREKVDYKRREVIEVTNAAIKSQRIGEFLRNRQKYNKGNVAFDGLPIIKPKIPQILMDYENGILDEASKED